MTAAQYPVTFGYKAQDGYWYGPNGRIGLFHRGNDRACPTGTPIVIGGVTIGLTGATGAVSGPHLHTQVCTAGSNYADDFNPSPYEFKFGTVINTSYHSQFGNRIIIRVGGVDITYAHLSKINVAVGQQIGNNQMIIPDADNWFARFNKLMLQVRGRYMTRDEFRKNFVGVEAFRMVEVVSDNTEADNATKAQSVGQIALKDDWQGQIYRLQAQIVELGKRPTQAQLSDLQIKINEFQAKVDDANLQAEAAKKRQQELELDKAESVQTGNRFIEWIGRLFKGGTS